jgi:hypothetical protein
LVFERNTGTSGMRKTRLVRRLGLGFDPAQIFPPRHSGAPRSGEPGIQNRAKASIGLWIPGSRPEGRASE